MYWLEYILSAGLSYPLFEQQEPGRYCGAVYHVVQGGSNF